MDIHFSVPDDLPPNIYVRFNFYSFYSTSNSKQPYCIFALVMNLYSVEKKDETGKKSRAQARAQSVSNENETNPFSFS